MKNVLISDIKMQNLKFSPLSFLFALVQYLLTMCSFLPFGMVMHIQCRCLLEVLSFKPVLMTKVPI